MASLEFNCEAGSYLEHVRLGHAVGIPFEIPNLGVKRSRNF
jgi:hypothetical protein